MALVGTALAALAATSTLTISSSAVVQTAAKLAFLQEPTNALVGAAISPAVRVVVEDANGNTVASATNLIRVNLTGVYGLGGTLEVPARKGVAIFNNLADSTAGSYTLTASSPGLASATSTQFTIAVPPVTSIAVTPGSVTLARGQMQQFMAVVAGGPGTGVAWTLSPAMGSISSTGLYSAPSSITGLQSVIVTASSQADSTKSASATALITPNGTADTVYYVDNVQGSDANNGTSAMTAFATVAMVNSLNLTAGQTVAFKTGDVWHETLTITKSGSAGSPINYTSYGGGAQPVIDASDTVTGWTQGGNGGSLPATVWSHPQPTDPLLINFAGKTGTPVGRAAAVSAPYQFAWSSSTLYVYATSDPTAVVEVAARTSALTSPGASYITVTNLELRGGTDIVYCGVASPCAYWDFEGNTFDSGYGLGLRWLLNIGVSGAGLVVNNNTFRGTGGSGIGLANGGSAMDDLITNNTMTDLCKIFVAGSSEHSFCDAIALYSQTETDGGGQILNNTISEIGLTSGGAYGGGIHPDTVVNWDVEHNTITDTNYPGISLEKGSGHIARYNLLVNAGQYQYFSGLFIRAGDGLSISNILAEDNTVVGGYWACALLIYQNNATVTATNVNVSKNICTGASSGTQLWLDPGYAGAGNTFTSNGFGVPTAGFVYAGGVAYGTYQVLVSPIMSSIAGNPQFVSPSSGNYHLQSTSPDAGVGAFP